MNQMVSYIDAIFSFRKSTTVMDDAIEIHEGYRPGAIGALTELHGTYYGDLWGLGAAFEGEIAEGVAEFVARYDEADNGLWLALDEGTIVGAIAIDGQHENGRHAQLRWFILDPAYHGRGIGTALFDRAMDFCETTEFDRVFLWTVEELEAAVHLYRTRGFEFVKAERHDDWEVPIQYQRFELSLSD